MGFDDFKNLKKSIMKAFKILVLSLLFVGLFSAESKAQIINSLPWFKTDILIEDFKAMDWNSSYVFAQPKQSLVRNSKIVLAKKTYALPSNIKEVKTPVVIKRGNTCYEIGCATAKSCESCRMLWKDVNGDRKIQPRKELRCVCSSSGDQCKIRARKIKCAK